MIDFKVRGAWDRVTEAWTDKDRHDELFKAAVADNAFAWACARYRERGDDPIAKEQLARLSKAAVAAMMVTQTTRPAKDRAPYRSLIIVLACLLLAMLVALFVTKSIHDNTPPPTTKPERR
ncbi:MAG TPA: hypothetical protein VIV11_02880 [Kofleriaceae bacterium]